MSKDTEKKWKQSEIEQIVRNLFDTEFLTGIEKKLNSIPLKVSDDNSKKVLEDKIHELEKELKAKDDECEARLSEQKRKYQKKIDELKESNTDLSGKNSLYGKYFDNVLNLYKQVSSLSDDLKNAAFRNISLNNPLEFICGAVNEKNISTFYDYIMYEYSNLSDEVIDIYNQFVKLMCSVNSEFSLIEDKGPMNDNKHIEINKKHSGQIKKIIVLGYKYSISENTIKKSLVEVK